MSNSCALVTATTPDFIKKLKWTLPSWAVKKQFRECPLYIFHHGFDKPDAELTWASEYFDDVRAVEWNMDQYENQRELMISAFVLGAAQMVEEDYCIKLDADAYCVDSQDVFTGDDFDYDLVSHPWSYTKPGWWVDRLKAWVTFGDWDQSKEKPGKKHDKRIISFCCLHKTAFLRKVAHCCMVKSGSPRLPVPSHDTLLWFMAEHFEDCMWKTVNMKKRGVGHSGRVKSIRESICSKRAPENKMLADTIMNNVQIEITTKCNLACPSCDRNCGTAKSDEHMTVDQVNKFVDESIEANHKWSRIDIIGGEPTLHPDLSGILDAIRRYRDWHKCRVRLTTNGTGSDVKAALQAMPEWVDVRNSEKESGRDSFDAVNLAPADEGVENADACSIPWRCGIALTRYGFFPCGAGASICRVFGKNIGIGSLCDVRYETLSNQMDDICRLCGHSRSTCKQTSGQETSASWAKAFRQYSSNKPPLHKY